MSDEVERFKELVERFKELNQKFEEAKEKVNIAHKICEDVKTKGSDDLATFQSAVIDYAIAVMDRYKCELAMENFFSEIWQQSCEEWRADCLEMEWNASICEN